MSSSGQVIEGQNNSPNLKAYLDRYAVYLNSRFCSADPEMADNRVQRQVWVSSTEELRVIDQYYGDGVTVSEWATRVPWCCTGLW